MIRLVELFSGIGAFAKALTSLTVSVTDECNRIGIGRGDKVRIIFDRE